jgi:glycosyltransferase involved in cell wall biosynthesis
VIEYTHDFSSERGRPPSRARRLWNGARQVLWTQLTLPLAARGRVDVLLSPAYVGPYLSPAPLVLMVLDLTFLLEPETGDALYMTYLRQLVPRLAGRARRIITISHSAAEEIARLLPGTEGKIDVAYPGPGGLDPFPDPPPQAGEGESPHVPYVLMVGTLEPRKNHRRALEAFRLFAQRSPEWRLVIAGGPGWRSRGLGAAIDGMGLRDRVELLGPVAAPRLTTLYRGAGALFYPSLYEGFGFPILEAMTLGCPVVTSNRSSMAEVGDAAVLQVDPLDPESMAGGLQAIASDPARRAELVARGRQRAAEFSWERFGTAVERSLQRAAGSLPT